MRLVTFLLCGAWKGTDDLVMFCKWQGRAVEGVGGWLSVTYEYSKREEKHKTFSFFPVH